MFDIVTYCSENYADSLNFCLPFWANNSGCERIIVYTDGQWSWPQVEIKTNVIIFYRPEFSHSADWLTNVGRLPEAAKKYVESVENGRRFAFLGTDCIFVRDVKWMFDKLSADKWLGVYRRDKIMRTIPDTFYAIVNGRCREMVRDWSLMSDCYRFCEIGTRKNYVAHDQISFDVLILMKYLKELCESDRHILMNECDNPKDWQLSITDRIHGLHFKGGRWRDKELVKDILKLAKVA